MGLELVQRQEELEEMEDITFKELVYHIINTLIAVKPDDSVTQESYNQLLVVIRHSEHLAVDEAALLMTTLKALSRAVSFIDINRHFSLLDSIFRMRVWNYGPEVMDSLLVLIRSLAASNGKYVYSCLDMLVSNFVPPVSLVALLKQPHGQTKKEQVLTWVHSALKEIVDCMPMAALELYSIVVGKLHSVFQINYEKDHLKYRAEIYLKNVLMLESGSLKEFFGSSLLMAVMDILIQFDMMMDRDESPWDDSCKGIFVMDLEDEANDDDAEFPRTLSQKSLGNNIIADLLDRLMMQTFEHLESCARSKCLSEAFETLLDVFIQTILKSDKPKFSQFVIFYACALDPENCGVKFAETLADKFFYDNNPDSRKSAVAYLASYLARGKFLSAAFVASILRRLVDWCSEYSKTRDGVMNPKAHQVFYSGCQAIIYVLCFHMRSMMDVPWLRKRLLLMPLMSILKHKLEPLKVCLPSMVGEFLKQAKAAHLFSVSETFIFEDDLLKSELSRNYSGPERLDMFFPFDPCLLKNCDRNFIRPNFLMWKDVRTTYVVDEEDSGNEDTAEDFVSVEGENFMEEGMARSFDEQDLDFDEFDYAMNKMSTTPNDRSNYRLGGEQVRMPPRIRPSTSPKSL